MIDSLVAMALPRRSVPRTHVAHIADSWGQGAVGAGAVGQTDLVSPARIRRGVTNCSPAPAQPPLLDLDTHPTHTLTPPTQAANPSVAVTAPRPVRCPIRFSVTDRGWNVTTVKLAELVAVPPGVFTETCPLVAPVGTVAVICVAELTVKAAVTPLNFTEHGTRPWPGPRAKLPAYRRTQTLSRRHLMSVQTGARVQLDPNEEEGPRDSYALSAHH